MMRLIRSPVAMVITNEFGPSEPNFLTMQGLLRLRQISLSAHEESSEKNTRVHSKIATAWIRDAGEMKSKTTD